MRIDENVRFIPPNTEIAEKNRQSFKPGAHGYVGPLTTSFPEFVSAAEVPIQEVWQHNSPVSLLLIVTLRLF